MVATRRVDYRALTGNNSPPPGLHSGAAVQLATALPDSALGSGTILTVAVRLFDHSLHKCEQFLGELLRQPVALPQFFANPH
jgi:hypothetical protein